MDSSFFLSFSPLACFSGIAGPEEDEEPSGEDVLRLIQARSATPSLVNISLSCQDDLLYDAYSDATNEAQPSLRLSGM
jgi:hypothetical protein